MTDKILIVDDEFIQTEMLATLIQRTFQFPAIKAENGQEALNILEQENLRKDITLVIMDVNMPILGGIDALKIMQENYPELPVIMLTGSKDITDAVKCIKAGAIDFISKPFEKERMVTTIKNALKLKILKQEVTRLSKEQTGEYGFNQLIGADGGLKACVEIGRKLASSDIPALITGPTGSGKEVFSRAIHGESHRASAPFIAVNCGAIPAQLVESTLFGHEKGAFTGAVDKVPGKFREADGGTIFLDEVGELPLEAQVKLLRVLQQKEVEVVGAAKPVPINVRIISATNRNLEQEVEKGNFREDLYFRLNVLEIHLPALRYRKQDIMALAQHFIKRACARDGRIPLALTQDAQDKLLSYDWPGNVRELENTIHRAIVLCDGMKLNATDFDFGKSTPQYSTTHSQETQKSRSPYQHENGKFKTLEDIEKEAMNAALEYYDQNITQAAKALGMAKSTFYRKQSTYNGNE